LARGNEEEGARVVDQKAEPGIGGDELGGDDHEERQAKADAQPGDDVRQGGWQHDIAENIALGGAEARRRTDQQRIDVFDAFERRREDREERGISDKRNF
jgi:hypothetical protein